MAFVPPAYFDTLFWAQRDGEQDDPEAQLFAIRPGELDAAVTANRRIFKQFEDATSWSILFDRVIGPTFAELELAIGSVDVARYLSTAEGRNLDEIGALVNRSRGGLSDDLYRLAIQADAGTLFTSGTGPELVALVTALFGPDTRVQDVYPATVLIQAPNIDAEVFQLMLDVLQDATSAGVALVLSTFNSLTGGGTPRSTVPGAVHENKPGRFGSTRGGTSDDLSFLATSRGVAAIGAP